MTSYSNILLLGDTSNRSNWGCRATSNALKSLVSQAKVDYTAVDMLEIFEGEKVMDFKETRRHNSSLYDRVIGRIKAKVNRTQQSRPVPKNQDLDDCTVENLEKIARDYKNGKRFASFKTIADQTDYLLINGEGAFLKDRKVGRMKLILAHLFMTIHNKPAAICNHTADLDGARIRSLAKVVYPLFESVLVREEFSLAELKGIGISSARLAADAAFLYRPSTREEVAPFFQRQGYFNSYPSPAGCLSSPYIVFSGSSYFYLTGVESSRFVSSLESLLQSLNRLLPVVVVIASIPDDKILIPLAIKLGIPFVELNAPTGQALDVLAHARLHVGGRWHPAILAATGGTPSIMLDANSSYKSNGLLRLLGLGQSELFRYELLDQAIPAIIGLAEMYLNAGEILRDSLIRRANQLAATCGDNLGALKGNFKEFERI